MSNRKQVARTFVLVPQASGVLAAINHLKAFAKIALQVVSKQKKDNGTHSATSVFKAILPLTTE